MQYKPLENVIKYLVDLYQGAKGIAQKIENSLMPSKLELALEGVPNPVLNRQPETPDKLQGYLFADYGIRGYEKRGRDKVVVTRSDGKQISIDSPKNDSNAEVVVRQALTNNGIKANNKIIGKIAKELRERN